jgi:multidrug resistance efflux pump
MPNHATDLKQVEKDIQSAYRLVEQAAKNRNKLRDAENALQQAKQTYRDTLSYNCGIDKTFVEISSELITQCETELKKAKK